MAPQDLVPATLIDGTPFVASQNSRQIAEPRKHHPRSEQTLTQRTTRASPKSKSTTSSILGAVNSNGSFTWIKK
jgi:hypothetical protein